MRNVESTADIRSLTEVEFDGVMWRTPRHCCLLLPQ